MAAASSGAAPPRESESWTLRLRRLIDRELPLDHLLPERQPYYIGSWVYVFGVITIAALVWVVISGVVGVAPILISLFFFSSVQLFFIFMVLHLWGQDVLAGWRHGRAATWMIGVVIFGASILTAFTGYLSQQNFDAQFIAINAKDAMNGAGIGAFFNVLNFGQMYGLHIMLLPVLVTFLVVSHIVMVRMRGVVKPIDPEGVSKS